MSTSSGQSRDAYGAAAAWGLLFWVVRHPRGQWEAQVLLLRALGLSVWPAPELHLNRFWGPTRGHGQAPWSCRWLWTAGPE